MSTEEELRKQYIAEVAAFKLAQQRKLERELFIQLGDFTLFHKLEAGMLGNWEDAKNEHKETGDTPAYIIAREKNCSVFYEQGLVDYGVADRTFTDEERKYYALRSFVWELRNFDKEEPEKCCWAFLATRKYRYDVHKILVSAFATEQHLIGKEDIRPIVFVSKYQEQIYDASEEVIDPFAGIIPTTEEILQYEDYRSQGLSL